MDQLLKTEGITKFFGSFRALNQVDLNVNSGEIVLIIGPNGSGKTTLINVITGALKADEGHVYFMGADVTNQEPYVLYHMGLTRTFQNPRPLSQLTVLENLLVGYISKGEKPWYAPFYSSWLKEEEDAVERAANILAFLKLSHLIDRRAGELSGGQMKLVEVGRALMTKPKLIVMDEPIAGVAPGLAHQIFTHILSLKKDGISFLIVEHRLDIILTYIDTLYVMFNGEIIAQGRGTKEIQSVLQDPKVKEIYIGD